DGDVGVSGGFLVARHVGFDEPAAGLYGAFALDEIADGLGGEGEHVLARGVAGGGIEGEGDGVALCGEAEVFGRAVPGGGGGGADGVTLRAATGGEEARLDGALEGEARGAAGALAGDPDGAAARVGDEAHAAGVGGDEGGLVGGHGDEVVGAGVEPVDAE